MAALAAVAVLTASRPDTGDGSSRPATPTINDGAAPPVARVAPAVAPQTPKFVGNALAFGAGTGLQVARAISGLPSKPARGNTENVSSFVPDKQIAVVRSASARQSRNDFLATRDPFRPLQTRRGRSGPVGENNGWHDHGVVAFVPVAPLLQPGRQKEDPAAPGNVTDDVTPLLTPGSEEPLNAVAPPSAPGSVSTASSAAAISAAVASAEDPAGPSPTLTAARGVAADDSAVTRYLSDSRRSGLFRYASSQAVSTPLQPELLR
jgi:hypothetical protein